MKLYCVRHGQALPPSSSEPDPILSPEGEAAITRTASYLHNRGVSVSYVFSSHKKRARQTAGIICEKMELLAQPEATDLLEPNKSLDALIDEIEHWCDDTLLVSHMPYIGELVSRLVSQQTSHEVVKYTPGTVACLERGDGNQWIISWVLRADLLAD